MGKFNAVFIRGFNNYDVKVVSDENATVNLEASLTQQHFKDECDINRIVERFGLTGELPRNVRAPMYGDFTGVSDYRSALHAVMAAEDSFMQLDPAVRRKFDNDPALFVDFCSDPGNIDAMREMGLAVSRSDSNVSGDGSVGAVVGGKVVAADVGGGRDAASVGGSKGGSGSSAEGGR